jgi:hypothetical protein
MERAIGAVPETCIIQYYTTPAVGSSRPGRWASPTLLGTPAHVRAVVWVLAAIISHLRWADRAGGEKAAGLAGYFLLAARVLVSCAYYTTVRVYLLGKGFRKVAMRKKENEKLQNQDQKTRVRLPWICGKRLKKWGRIPVRTAKNGYKTDIFSLAHGQVLGIYRHKAQKGADRKFEFFVNDSCKI